MQDPALTSCIPFPYRCLAYVDIGNDEPAPPKTISPDVGKAMQTARQELGMKQSDLATKVNEKVGCVPVCSFRHNSGGPAC